MTKKYKATIIGSIITLFCLATTWTLTVPILTLIPIGLPLERLFSGGDYSKTAFGVLFYLIALFVLTGLWLYRKIKIDFQANRELNTGRLILFFIIQFFIIHPLVFYIWAISNSADSSDGQFIFGVVETFPISSFAFVILGLVIDGITFKKAVKNIS